MKKKSGLTPETIDRYVDMVREYGIDKALDMQKEIMKSKKKFERNISKK